MTTFIVILISIYLLSVLACWNWMRIAHNAGGVNENEQPSLEDVFLILIPLLNTMLAFICWNKENPRKDPKKASDRTNKWLNKLFCVKK